MTKYHSVADVCHKLGVKPYVLRYWEKEFEFTPKRNSAGRRIYSTQQLEKLQLIKHLLHEEKLTTKGARRRLAGPSTAPPDAVKSSKGRRQVLLWLKTEPVAIRALLEDAGR